MREKADVGLADLLIAVERLDARDPSLVSRIAQMLHLEFQPHAEPVRPRPATERVPARRAPDPPPPPHAPHPDSRPSLINRSRTSARSFATPLPSLAPPTDEEHEPPPPFEPLFRLSWSRAILSTALATPNANGAVDVDRVVEQLGQGRAITSLPHRLVPTLRKGVQVLVDHSSGMVPFRRDAAWLVREIELVVGKENSNILRFRGIPTRGIADPRCKTRRPYEPPPRAVPVVFITDFGIGVDDLMTDRATAREWVGLLRSLGRTNDLVLAFVPYPRHRCPRRIAEAATIIEFDRHTTLARIRAAVTRAWRRQ